MIIKRKIYKKIKAWKAQSQGTKALLIEGARRIGKSTIAEEIGKNEYDSYILIDFNNASKKVLDAFDDLTNLDIFFQTLSLEYNKRLFNRKSLIIFDEIQKFPKARQAIKYLVQDGRYDFIETGSLISIKENVENITLPSEERKIKMYPVDFEEFMVYMDEELLLEHISDCFKNRTPLDQKLHSKAMRLFKEYMLVGGMPQALVAYKDNGRDFFKADIEKRDILGLYKDDIKKATKNYKNKVSALFENIPAYLSTHEKRIILNNISRGESFSQFEGPLFWLDDSMICILSFKCNDPSVGLALNKNNSYVKCYMGDTGLLVSLAFSENELSENNLYKQILDDKLSLNKGMLFENVVAQMIAASNRKLYFYTRYNYDKHRNDIEVDFIITNESKTNYKISPIEVKSSKNYTTKSLDRFSDVFAKKIDTKFIVHPKNLTVEEGLMRIPAYMICEMLKTKTAVN